ncbi:MAG: SEC-C metal-binding domain-containing protein [Gaiellaceae bacterium]
MAKVGRNEPCPCGSARKAKRCCGVRRGPSDDQLARASLAGYALAAAPWLLGLDEDQLEELWDEVLDLPARDLTLHFPLPDLFTPELDRLVEAIRDEEADWIADALSEALDRVDTPLARASLARAVIALRDARRIEPQIAAAAIVDLEGGSRSFLGAALVEAAAVAAGVARTPCGLVVASTLAA